MKMRGLLAVPLLVMLLASTVLAGSAYCCSWFCPEYRRSWDTFGEAFRTARNNQILNPDAHLNQEPVEGLDGFVAERVYIKYLESFTRQPGGAGGAGPVGFVPLVTSPGGAK
jgi:hypothetical protein